MLNGKKWRKWCRGNFPEVRRSELIASLDESASEEKQNQVESFFWMIREFEVSLFAQELKTAFPVSEKRLQKMYDQIKRLV